MSGCERQPREHGARVRLVRSIFRGIEKNREIVGNSMFAPEDTQIDVNEFQEVVVVGAA